MPAKQRGAEAARGGLRTPRASRSKRERAVAAHDEHLDLTGDEIRGQHALQHVDVRHRRAVDGPRSRRRGQVPH